MKSCEGNAVSVVTARSIGLESWRAEGRRVYSLVGGVKAEDSDCGIDRPRDNEKESEKRSEKQEWAVFYWISCLGLCCTSETGGDSWPWKQEWGLVLSSFFTTRFSQVIMFSSPSHYRLYAVYPSLPNFKHSYLPLLLSYAIAGPLQSHPFTPLPLYRAKVSDVISHTIAALGFWSIGGGLGPGSSRVRCTPQCRQSKHFPTTVIIKNRTRIGFGAIGRSDFNMPSPWGMTSSG